MIFFTTVRAVAQFATNTASTASLSPCAVSYLTIGRAMETSSSKSLAWTSHNLSPLNIGMKYLYSGPSSATASIENQDKIGFRSGRGFAPL